MSINEFVDMVFYINLEERTDKRDVIETMLKEYDIIFERFNAIKQSPGFVGASASHLEVLKLARERKYKNVLILEDDFMFLFNKEQVYSTVQNFFNKYGNDYDVFMLQANLKDHSPIKDDPEFIHVCISHGSAGYIINERLYDTIIRLYEWSLPRLAATHQHWVYNNDLIWFRLQYPVTKWYSTPKRLGRQRPCISDSNPGVFVDYGC